MSVLVGCSNLGVEEGQQRLPSQTQAEKLQCADSQETEMPHEADPGSTSEADKEITESYFLGAIDF